MKNWYNNLSSTAKGAVIAMAIGILALLISETVCNAPTDNTRAILPDSVNQ